MYDNESFRTEDVDVKTIGFGQRSLKFVLVFMFIIDVLVNVDHGAVPSALVVLKEELELQNDQMGIMGSLVFIGLLFGSFIASIVFNYISYKKVLAFSFFGNGLGLVLFTMTTNI